MVVEPRVFPIQKLPLSKKDKAWREASLDAVLSRRSRGYTDRFSRRERIKIEQDLYEGIFNEKDLKYVTDPFKVAEDSFPATLQNFNIIRPKLNLLIGEQSKRPISYTVVQSNETSSDSIVGEIKEIISEMLLRYQQMNQGDDITEDQISEIEQKISRIKSKYFNPAEQVAQHTLDYLKYFLNLSDQFLSGWKDYLINGESIYYVGIVNGDPYFERVDPKYCDYDNDPELTYIEDGDWFRRRIPMTISAIYDRFYDIMDESDLDDLLKLAEGNFTTQGKGDSVNTKSIIYRDSMVTDRTFDEGYNYNLLNVYHGVWKSYKKIGFLTTVDEIGQEKVVIVDETYKPDEGEKIEWDWVIEVWEGYKIGDDMYIGIKPVDYQSISLDNPNSQKLPYGGIAHKGRSLVSVMKSLQYMYIIIWYRLELALARDKGRVITMDITQIPKSMGIEPNKWLHYLTALGVNFINPYEEGWDIPGREGGKPAAYNQMSSIDLSMSNVIAQYIQLMDKIEEMIGEISGVSKQRQGQVQASELVGNVQQTITQSSHITEPLFWVHNQSIRRALNMILNTAKYAWSVNKKAKLDYILSDGERVFLNVTDDFLYSDFDVYVYDSSIEHRNIETLKSLLQPAMQNGATLTDVANILTMNNMSQIKSKLEEIEQRRTQIEQQMAQQQNEIEQNKLQVEMQTKAEELRIKEEDSIRKAETQIQVALIGANSKMDDGSESDDQIKREKLNVDREKMMTSSNLEKMKLNEASRKNKADENMRRQELQIKRITANKKQNNK
jgi:hypothetical protein